MQSVKGAQFLSITYLFGVFTAAPAAAVFGTVMIPLTSMYPSLKSDKYDLITDVLNLMF